MASIHSCHYVSTKHFQNPNHYFKFKCCSISNHRTKIHQIPITRRFFTSISLSTTLLIKDLFFTSNIASSFGFTTPDQLPEEANIALKLHATNLAKIKSIIDSKSWRVVQMALRERSSLLKQDLSTMIEAKPGRERAELRRLYTNLFNFVTDSDNAASEKDEIQVQQCYDNIITALNEISARV